MNPNTADFYDAYWASDQCASYLRDAQLDAIAASIVNGFGTPPLVVMDIGGGISRIARQARACGHQPAVLDLSPAAVQIMRSEGIEARVFDVNGWGGEPVMLGVDVVTCTEVLEHLDDPDKAIACAAAHARRAVFTVPNACMGPEETPMHVRMYDAGTLRAALAKYYTRISITTMYRWLVAECHV